MENLMILLFGVGCGVGGTLLWLRKDIRKELEQIRKDSETPFEMSAENEKKEGKNDKNEAKNGEERRSAEVKNEERTNYNAIINREYSGLTGVPVMPRDTDISEEDDDPEANFVGNDETDGGIIEIDRETFDNDESYEKDRLVYFRGDRIVCTENGKIITNPFMLIGGEWENCVGNYTKNTAFIRNCRLSTDYEIFVEDGLYEDEYGPVTDYRED